MGLGKFSRIVFFYFKYWRIQKIFIIVIGLTQKAQHNKRIYLYSYQIKYAEAGGSQFSV